jgi:TMEM175 potassium channel family protein
MSKGRLEAFSDGVLAIIITIMVLELKTPHEATPEALLPLVPTLLSYLLSFVHIGIYWNNHHHLFQAAHHVNGRILWANLHLLLWLSLIPFVTGWMGHTHFAAWPVAVYGIVLLLSGVAYYLLTLSLIGHHGRVSTIAIAVGRDWKTRMSIVAYLAAVALAFVEPLLSCSLYALVAMAWIVPDCRIEVALAHRDDESGPAERERAPSPSSRESDRG